MTTTKSNTTWTSRPHHWNSIDWGIGLRFHLSSLLQRFELTPLRVAILYLGLGLLSLYASDVLLVRVLEDPFLSRVQSVKGGLEVVVTAGLIYGLTTGSRAPLELKNGRLERQRQELQVLHRVLRHNLRNNLNIMLGCMELARKETGPVSSEDRYDTAEACVKRLLAATEQASEINHISSSGGEPTSNDLAESIPRILENHDLLGDDVKVDVALPETARVEAHPMLDVAIEELLTNAIVHNDSADPSVSISVEPGEGLISETRIHVEDNGPGLPQNAMTVFERAMEDRLVHLDGLGLWKVQWIMAESHGRMELEAGEWGTKVTLTVPSAFEVSTTQPAMATG